MLILLLKIGACLELFATYCVAMYSVCKPSIISYVEKVYKNSHTIFIVFFKVFFLPQEAEKSQNHLEISSLMRVQSPMWVSKTALIFKFPETISLFHV